MRVHPDDAVNAAIWDQIYKIFGTMVDEGCEVALRTAPKSRRRRLSAFHRLGDALEAFGVEPFLLELARVRDQPVEAIGCCVCSLRRAGSCMRHPDEFAPDGAPHFHPRALYRPASWSKGVLPFLLTCKS